VYLPGLQLIRRTEPGPAGAIDCRASPWSALLGATPRFDHKILLMKRWQIVAMLVKPLSPRICGGGRASRLPDGQTAMR